MDSKTQINTYEKQLLSAKTDNEKIRILLPLIVLLIREDIVKASSRIEEGFFLSEINIEDRFKLYESKLLYLNQSGEVEKALKLIDEYEAIIPNEDKFFKYILYKDIHKMVLFTYLSKILDAIEIAKKTIPKAEKLNDREVNIKLTDMYRIAAQLELRVANVKKAIILLDKSLALKKNLGDLESIFNDCPLSYLNRSNN